MIIRPALPPDATLIDRINEATERARLVMMTCTLPIAVTLGDAQEAA